MRDDPFKYQVKALHPYAWLWECLEADPGFALRAMFGTKTAYLDGRLTLCFSASKEPWRGVLVCTSHAHHHSLMAEFPVLKPHPILPKWLYLPEALDEFEKLAQRLVALAKARDPRLGVLPKPKRALKIGKSKRSGTQSAKSQGKRSQRA